MCGELLGFVVVVTFNQVEEWHEEEIEPSDGAVCLFEGHWQSEDVVFLSGQKIQEEFSLGSITLLAEALQTLVLEAGERLGVFLFFEDKVDRCG